MEEDCCGDATAWIILSWDCLQQLSWPALLGQYIVPRQQVAMPDGGTPAPRNLKDCSMYIYIYIYVC